MSQQTITDLEGLLRKNDLGWTIDMLGAPHQALGVLENRLREFAARYKRRAGVEGQFTPENLELESSKNPQKIRAFLQALAATGSADLLVMVWKILQGYTIHRVNMDYQAKTSFKLRVELKRTDDDEQTEVYESNDVNDTTLVTHFGIAEIDGRPVFDGFFPLRIRSVRR